MKCSRTRALEKSVEVSHLRAQRVAHGEEPFDEGSSCELALSAGHGSVADVVPYPEQIPPIGKCMSRGA